MGGAGRCGDGVVPQAPVKQMAHEPLGSGHLRVWGCACACACVCVCVRVCVFVVCVCMCECVFVFAYIRVRLCYV